MHILRAALLGVLAAVCALGQTWTQLNPSVKPFARVSAAMAFDVRNGNAMLFGGRVGDIAALAHASNDTWIWDGSNWTAASPATSPSARYGHAMAYDAGRNEVVLFGGSDAANNPLGDTWIWNGTTWTQRTPAVSPTARAWHAMAYDPVRRVMLLFGGEISGVSDGTTWAWDGTNWQKLSPATAPTARHGHAMAWDPVRQNIVLYGGAGFQALPGPGLTDTWVWDGTNWVARTGGRTPPTLLNPVMVTDSTTNRVLLIGGFRESSSPTQYRGASKLTWSWTGTEWTQLLSNNAPELMDIAGAHDPVRSRTIIFGGQSGTGLADARTLSFTPGTGCEVLSTLDGPINVGWAGGAGEFPVQVTAGCQWTAGTPVDVPWLTATTPAGTGLGTVRYSVLTNASGYERSGIIEVANNPIVVVQGIEPCPTGGPLPTTAFSVRATCGKIDYTYTARAGEQIAIQAIGRGQTYGPRDSVMSAYASIRVMGPSSATTVIAEAAPRNFTNGITNLPASGVVTFPQAGSYTVSVMLTGGTAGVVNLRPFLTGQPCVPVASIYSVFGLSPTVLMDSIGGNGTAFVGLPPGCPNQAVSASVPWLQPQANAVARAGITEFTLRTEPNPGPQRKGNLTIGASAVEVTQLPNPCTVSLSSQAASVPAGVSKIVVDLATSGPACGWTVQPNNSWLQPYPLGGTGNAKIEIAVSPNFSTSVRVGSFYVGPVGFSVTQAGATGTERQRFVQLLYYSYFGRMPSPGETDFHANSGLSKQQLALNFFNSEEFNIGGRFVAGLYVGLLNRDAEYGGWLFQRNALAAPPVTQLTLVTNFLNSAEFAAKYGTLDNRAFVTLLYRQILLREPTPAEVDFHVGGLTAGLSRADLAKNFLNAAEFRIGTGPRLTAFLVYATLLQRQPSDAEFAAGIASAAQIQAINDVSARQAALRDQMLAPIVNGTEMFYQLQ